MGAVSVSASRLMDLRNEKEVTQRYYNDMRQQLEGAELKSRMEKEEAGIEISIIEEPKVPLEPIPTQKGKTVFMGFIIALAAGAGLAYLVDSLDRSVKSSPELRHLLHIPVVGVIDRINTNYDMKITKVRRNTIIISLLVFAILSNVIFRLVMGVLLTIKL
jgi:capsular polysaccharide biosynthesis protein